MGNFKMFMKNFWFSLLAYFAMYLVGALCLLFRNVTTHFSIVTDSPHGVPRGVEIVPWWVEIILWLHVLGSVAFYFYVGTRLKLIGNHFLNFLSVSASLALGFFVIFLGISNPYMLAFGGFSFLRLTILLWDWPNEYVATSIVSVLPTIIIWLGMLYKIKNKLGDDSLARHEQQN